MRSMKILQFLSLWSMVSAGLVPNDDTWEIYIKKMLNKFPEYGLSSRLGENSDENQDALAHRIVEAAKQLLKNSSEHNKVDDDRTSKMLLSLDSSEMPEEDFNVEIVTEGLKNEDYITKLSTPNTVKEKYQEVTTNKITEDVKTSDAELSEVLKHMNVHQELIGQDTAPNKGQDGDAKYVNFLKEIAGDPKLDSPEQRKSGQSMSVPVYVLGQRILTKS